MEEKMSHKNQLNTYDGVIILTGFSQKYTFPPFTVCLKE